MPDAKVTTVSLASIGRAVESAVNLAAARHKLAVEKETLIDRWEIFGRRLRDVKDLNIAYEFAEDVTRAVNVPGLKVTPVVTRLGRDILVGFVDKGRLSKLLPK